MSLCLLVAHSFLLLTTISFHKHTIIYLSIQMLMNISVVSSAGMFWVKLLWNLYTSVCVMSAVIFTIIVTSEWCHVLKILTPHVQYLFLPASCFLLPFLSSTKRAPLVFLFPGGNTCPGSASPLWRHLLFSLFHLWWTFSLKFQSVLWRHAWACKSSILALGQTLF